MVRVKILLSTPFQPSFATAQSAQTTFRQELAKIRIFLAKITSRLAEFSGNDYLLMGCNQEPPGSLHGLCKFFCDGCESDSFRLREAEKKDGAKNTCIFSALRYH